MPKLVEVLAKELKEWPELAVIAVQDGDGELKFSEDADANFDDLYKIWIRGGILMLGEERIIGELAEDHSTAIVTRAEWQAAVDALKEKDIASSTAAMIDAGWINPNPPVSPSLHAQVVGRANRITEWDGVGLPPVGVSCERRFPDVQGSSWNGCIILAHGARKIFVRDNCGDEWAHHLDDVEFRPFRTPEQIAAEERLHKIRNAHTSIAGTLEAFRGDIPAEAVSRQVIEAMIDAGYRKQEPK